MSTSSDERTVLWESLLRRIDHACNKFRTAWREGQQPRIEDYLGEVPEPDRPLLLGHLLDEELHERRRAGERPTPEEYRDRFPDYPEPIRDAFAPKPAGPTRPALEGEAPSGAASPPQVRGFEVKKWLGQGGLATTWKAKHVGLGRSCVLKVLRPERFSLTRLEALRQEAQTMVRLVKNVNLVQVYGLHEEGPDRIVLELEYVEGGASGDWAPLPWQKAVRYVRDAAAGLKAVHAAGLVHGDITPGNLLWDSEHDRGVLGDFGLARHADQAAGGYTPGYAAPEVISGGRCGFPADVFGLAATLYGLLTKARPNDEHGLLKGWDDLRRALEGVPAGVQDVIRAGLEADPERRPSLVEFHEHLRAICPVRLMIELYRLRDQQRQLLLRHTNQDAADDPGQVEVRTGDKLVIVAHADRAGHVTILNFGGGGDIDVLLPFISKDGEESRTFVAGNEPVDVEVNVLPPASTDQVAVIWTPRAESGPPKEWRRRIAEGRLTSDTRRMEPVGQPGKVASSDHWTAVVVTVVHRASC
jgi:serine/threonine protein kinase